MEELMSGKLLHTPRSPLGTAQKCSSPSQMSCLACVYCLCPFPSQWQPFPLYLPTAFKTKSELLSLAFKALAHSPHKLFFYIATLVSRQPNCLPGLRVCNTCSSLPS